MRTLRRQTGTIPLAAHGGVFSVRHAHADDEQWRDGWQRVVGRINRALSAGDRERAGTLALRTMAIGAGVGVLYSLLFVLCGPLFSNCWAARAVLKARPLTRSCCSAARCWCGCAIHGVGGAWYRQRVPSTVVLLVAVLQIALALAWTGTGAHAALGHGYGRP